MLALFIKMFPDIHVSVLNGNSRDIELALRDGKITLGLVDGTTRQNTMHYIPFMKDELNGSGYLFVQREASYTEPPTHGYAY